MSLRDGIRSGLYSTVRSGLDMSAGVTLGSTTLTVTIADSVDPVISLVNFTYAVIVTNTGVVDATSVSCVVTLDPSLTFVSAVGAGWATGAVGQVVTCTRATLAVGAAPTITVTVTTADAASTETTTADASASNAPAATQDVETTVVKLVDRDTLGAKRFPSSATQWADFNAYHVAIGTPNFPNVTPYALWRFQEASGNPADSIDAVTLTQSGAGHLYQQATTWTRLAIQGVDGTASQKWINSTTAANPNTTDTALVAIMELPAGSPAAARDVMGKNATGFDLRFNTTGKLRVIFGASADLTVDNRGTVIICGVQVNNTGSVSAVYTNTEKFIGTYGLPGSGAVTYFGGQTAAASAIKFLGAFEFSGAAARMTAAQWKALYESMGWVIGWS